MPSVCTSEPLYLPLNATVIAFECQLPCQDRLGAFEGLLAVPEVISVSPSNEFSGIAMA